jgi:hypothetical protein
MVTQLTQDDLTHEFVGVVLKLVFEDRKSCLGWPVRTARSGSYVSGGRGCEIGASKVMLKPCDWPPVGGAVPNGYSTVTLLARFRGWSTSVPLATAV